MSWWARQAYVPDLDKAVDWTDRRVFVAMPDSQGNLREIELDCRQFEMVCRAAKGLMSRAFFQADIRRIASQLGVMAANAARSEEITVLLRGRPTRLVIDVGDVILATGT
jgi:hypothetical protein